MGRSRGRKEGQPAKSALLAPARQAHHLSNFSKAAEEKTLSQYRDRLKGVQILLSNSQAGPGSKVKQEQEEISRNHVQAF